LQGAQFGFTLATQNLRGEQMRHCTRSLTIVVAAAIALAANPLLSQAPPASQSFEAASIKLNLSGANGMGNRQDPQRISFTNVSLRVFIEQAYEMKDYQVLDAPNWMNTDRWDITATTDHPTTFTEKFEMVKTLLADRFQLKFHSEKREMAVYSLIALKDGPRFLQPKDDTLPGGIRVATGLLSGHKFDVSMLPFWLSSQLNIPVVDKAGLKGIYDFTLQWTPVPNEGNFNVRYDQEYPTAAADPGPTIFSALPEQLGLKLESAKGPVDVLVIDSVQKPTEN
jgi:uncharacterized protein (TIGR03435 family)